MEKTDVKRGSRGQRGRKRSSGRLYKHRPRAQYLWSSRKLRFPQKQSFWVALQGATSEGQVIAVITAPNLTGPTYSKLIYLCCHSSTEIHAVWSCGVQDLPSRASDILWGLGVFPGPSMSIRRGKEKAGCGWVWAKF